MSVPAARGDVPHQAYADALIAECDRRAPELRDRQLETVFFGGGTPSLWEPTELARVLASIRQHFPRAREPLEVTVECNPSSFDEQRARALRRSGVTRISLGVQGLDDERLRFLGRLHSAAEGLKALGTALGAGFDDVSADLIFGIAGQSSAAAADEALQLARMGPNHLSAYSLTIEPGTQFGALHARGRLPLLDENIAARAFSAVHDTLSAEGYEHYEISNFARHGRRARHNLGYWQGHEYLGLGCGAWGTLRSESLARQGAWQTARVRYRNTPSPERYLAAAPRWRQLELWQPGAHVPEIESIADDTHLSERLMLGLRLAEGVDLDELQRSVTTEVRTRQRQAAIERLCERGRLARAGERVWIPAEAWLFADDTIAQLL